MNIDYLPIGTVVRLNKSEDLFVIIGLAVRNEDGETRDYLAVRYPVGALSPKNYYFFNHNMIKTIIYQGYDSADHESYKNLLNVVLSERYHKDKTDNKTDNKVGEPYGKLEN